MRTAITLAKRHGPESKWEILCDPDTPLQEQLQSFRALFGSKAHKDFAQVFFQESDQPSRKLRFMTEDAAAIKEKEDADHDAQLQRTMQRIAARPDPEVKKHEREVAEHSTNIERIKADQEADKAAAA
jgi:hypothetical protein